MSTQSPSSAWSAEEQISSGQSVINFLARRRIAISLIGFSTLVFFNVVVRRTVPLNPLEVFNPWVASALLMFFGGLAIRSWSAGTLNKSRQLTTHGPYALTRNPLYVGSFLMMFAFCMFCRDLPTALFVAGPMVFLYRVQVLFEEQRLGRLFPSEWPAYKASVPRFIPMFFRSNAIGGWTLNEWKRNREYRTLAASLGALVVICVWHWWSVAAS